jgi:hypothetical protein
VEVRAASAEQLSAESVRHADATAALAAAEESASAALVAAFVRRSADFSEAAGLTLAGLTLLLLYMGCSEKKGRRPRAGGQPSAWAGLLVLTVVIGALGGASAGLATSDPAGAGAGAAGGFAEKWQRGPGPSGRLSALRVSHSESILHGAFAWALLHGLLHGRLTAKTAVPGPGSDGGLRGGARRGRGPGLAALRGR